jgi:hypothetical protein
LIVADGMRLMLGRLAEVAASGARVVGVVMVESAACMSSRLPFCGGREWLGACFHEHVSYG